MQTITKTEKETYNFANNFAGSLLGGEVIGLTGDLGAGKTIFTKGLAKKLGVKEMVTSPTFVIMKIYKCHDHKTIKKLVHVDAYRLESEKEIDAIGIQEYLNNKETVVVVEWADKIKKALPVNTLYFKIFIPSHNERKIVKK